MAGAATTRNIVSVIAAAKRRPKHLDKPKGQADGTKHSRALTPGRLAQAVTGDAWTLHILRHSFAGARRYSAFRDRLRAEGMPIPELVLADRLRRLVTLRVLDRRTGTSETSRREYWLTDRGVALWTILIAIRDWEAQYTAPGRGRVSKHIVHTRCGQTIHPVLSCGHCGVQITARDTEVDDSGAVALATPPPTAPNYRRSILRREPHAQGPRRRFYRLTDKGLALFAVVFFTVDWGNRWLASHPEDFRVIHKRCGVAFRPAFRCSHCGGPLARHEVQLVP